MKTTDGVSLTIGIDPVINYKGLDVWIPYDYDVESDDYTFEVYLESDVHMIDDLLPVLDSEIIAEIEQVVRDDIKEVYGGGVSYRNSNTVTCCVGADICYRGIICLYVRS